MRDMAALLVIGGFVCGVLACYLVMSELRDRERQAHVQALTSMRWEPQQVEPSTDLHALMLQRLIDIALPERVAEVDDEEKPGTPAEYEPPPPQVNDWTDPFFGMERDLVGGLSPGQAIPGIGPDADDRTDMERAGHDFIGAMERHWDDHPMANGFTPDDEDLPVEREAGDALFEEWMSKGAENAE